MSARLFQSPITDDELTMLAGPEESAALAASTQNTNHDEDALTRMLSSPMDAGLGIPESQVGAKRESAKTLAAKTARNAEKISHPADGETHTVMLDPPTISFKRQDLGELEEASQRQRNERPVIASGIAVSHAPQRVMTTQPLPIQARPAPVAGGPNGPSPAPHAPPSAPGLAVASAPMQVRGAVPAPAPSAPLGAPALVAVRPETLSQAQPANDEPTRAVAPWLIAVAAIAIAFGMVGYFLRTGGRPQNVAADPGVAGGTAAPVVTAKADEPAVVSAPMIRAKAADPAGAADPQAAAAQPGAPAVATAAGQTVAGTQPGQAPAGQMTGGPQTGQPQAGQAQAGTAPAVTNAAQNGGQTAVAAHGPDQAAPASTHSHRDHSADKSADTKNAKGDKATPAASATSAADEEDFKRAQDGAKATLENSL